MKVRVLAAAWLTLGVGLAGCNYYDEKDSGDDDSSGTTTPVDGTKLAFTDVVDDVFKPKCFTCHSNSGGSSGGLNTESYAAVKAKAAVIMSRAIESKDMPLGGSLSSDQYAKLKAWLEAGANETVSALAD